MKNLTLEDIDYTGDHWPTSQEEWDWEIYRKSYSGPGLLASKEYPDHYNPSEWNELNDSLVRTVKKRIKHPENYDQLLLGVSLV